MLLVLALFALVFPLVLDYGLRTLNFSFRPSTNYSPFLKGAPGDAPVGIDSRSFAFIRGYIVFRRVPRGLVCRLSLRPLRSLRELAFQSAIDKS